MKKTLLLCVSALFLAIGTYAQKTVTGTVTDNEGVPLIGVNILEQGTSNGTITDIDGSFSLDVQDEAVLLVSYTGMQTLEMSTSGTTSLNVVMTEDSELLDEVVVTALGFTEKRDNLGSAVSKFNVEDIQRSGEANFLNSLQSKASNVQINRSNGDPGAGSSIKIRGVNSIESVSSPLIVLDGVPINNSTIYGGGNNVTGGRTGGTSQQSRLNDINPNDIESVQVLKGASAAAVWGFRAAGGVIVITTKSGASGKPRITYKSALSFDKVHERYPLQTVWGQGRDGVYSPTRAEAWGDYIPDRAGGADVVDQSGQYYQAADGTNYYPIDEKNSQQTYVDENWDSVFQTGGFWSNDLSISGGNDRATYFMSLGRLDQEGIIRNSDYERNNVRLNTKFYLNDWLSISSKAGYTSSKSNRIQQSSNTAGLLLGLLRTTPDFDQRDYIGTYYDDDGNAFSNRQRAYRRYLGNNVNPIYNNPLWTINEQTADSRVDRFIMTTEINLTPMDWLGLTFRGGVDNLNDNRLYFFPIGSAGDRVSGVLAEDYIDNRELNFDAIAKANFDLTRNIGLTTTVGWNINDRKRSNLNYEIVGFLVDARKPTTDLNTANESSSVNNFNRTIRSNRGYTVIEFDIADKIFVDFSNTVEAASSAVGTTYYPAVDVAYKFTDDLNTLNSPLSFGKLRASWGKVGVQPPAYRTQTLAEGGFTYSTYSDVLDIGLFGGGFRIDDDQGDENLKPEIKTEWEIGTDLRLFNDKLAFSFTYYQNEIQDLLLSVALTPSSGFDTRFTNAGTMENKGMEFELEYNILRDKGWTVDFFGNWARNRNLVTDLAGTETINLSPGASVSTRAIEGHPLGVLYGTGSQMDEAGNFILDDNGFPQLTLSPEVLGDPNPDWRAGFGLRSSYKGINFSVLFDHSHGGEFSPRSLWVLRRFGTTQETANRVTLDQDLTNFDGDVIPAGTTVRGNIEDFGGGPVLLDETWYRHGIGGGFGDNQAYNFSIASAQFTRLREITLGYTIDSEAFRNKTKLGSVNLSISGRNLFLWDDIVGVDPEINQTGVSVGSGLEYFTNPSTKSYLFSLTVTY